MTALNAQNKMDLEGGFVASSITPFVSKFRRLSYIPLVALALVFGGCSVNASVPIIAEFEASVKLNEGTIDAEKVSAENSDPKLLETFTTKGKPTKTIETPLGARELYDPTQDEDVRKAFKRIYDRDEGVVHYELFVLHPSQGGKETYVLKDVLDDFGNKVILPNGMVQNSLHPRAPDADDLIVMQSLIEQRLGYRDLKCQKVKENTCNTTHIYQEDCFNGAPCYRVSQNGATCPSPLPSSLGGRRGIYSNDSHPIGKQFFAMRWLFDDGVHPPPAPLNYGVEGFVSRSFCLGLCVGI